DAGALRHPRLGLDGRGLAPLRRRARHAAHEAIEPEPAAHVAHRVLRQEALPHEHLVERDALLPRAREAALERLRRDAPRVAQERGEITVPLGRAHLDDLALAEQHLATAHLDAAVGAAL